MKILFNSRKLYITIALVVVVIVLLMIHGVGSNSEPELVTTTVETGPVRQLVSVSGLAKAKQTADLAFPTTGIVREVLVDVGDEVKAGDTLVTIDTRTLYADRQDAAAALARAIADRDELIAGPTASEKEVTAETLASKQEALATTKDNETQKVANAYHTLLSSGLTAYSNDPEEDAVPPTVSGTYSCNTEGDYILDVFNSASDSGYSYKLTGIENGTFVASTEQPTPMGSCGLRIQFDDASTYNRSQWVIEIPNTKSPSYISNRNAYALAKTQAESAIAVAEQEVELAQANASNQNAPARSEEITRANAAITAAKAKLARIDATISDNTLKAPFSGVITKADILPGETVTTAPIITILASRAFELTARIPEIDIGKLAVDQTVEMTFDARPDEIVLGDISFISPQSAEIDGVSYYEAIIQFRQTPEWMRSGLNADIEVIISEETGSIRIPKRFVTESDIGYTVLKMVDGTIASTSVEVLLTGNDGYYAITGLNAGDTVVAP